MTAAGSASTTVLPGKGKTVGERPGAAGVTEEHLPGPKTAGIRQGGSPTSPLYPIAASGGGVLGRDLVDMEGLSG